MRGTNELPRCFHSCAFWRLIHSPFGPSLGSTFFVGVPLSRSFPCQNRRKCKCARKSEIVKKKIYTAYFPWARSWNTAPGREVPADRHRHHRLAFGDTPEAAAFYLWLFAHIWSGNNYGKKRFDLSCSSGKSTPGSCRSQCRRCDKIDCCKLSRLLCLPVQFYMPPSNHTVEEFSSKLLLKFSPWNRRLCFEHHGKHRGPSLHEGLWKSNRCQVEVSLHVGEWKSNNRARSSIHVAMDKKMNLT